MIVGEISQGRDVFDGATSGPPRVPMWSTVTGERVATTRAAVHQVEQDIDTFVDDVVTRSTRNVGDEADAAGVVLEARIVKAMARR